MARFVCGGATMFGRRFLDPRDTTARDAMPAPNPTALVQSDDPYPGSAHALTWLGRWIEEADLASVNLETPVLSNPVASNAS